MLQSGALALNLNISTHEKLEWQLEFECRELVGVTGFSHLLKEAVEQFSEVADDAEIGRRIRQQHEGAVSMALEVAE